MTEIIENTPNIPTSQHPVLTALNEKIASLEAEVQTFKDEAFKEAQLRREMLVSKLKYEERVKNVLVEAMEDYDDDTIKHIASNLDIELTVTKSIQVNVTFNIDIEHEIGEEPDPAWDFDFNVEHDSIVDFTTDVIWSDKA